MQMKKVMFFSSENFHYFLVENFQTDNFTMQKMMTYLFIVIIAMGSAMSLIGENINGEGNVADRNRYEVIIFPCIFHHRLGFLKQ